MRVKIKETGEVKDLVSYDPKTGLDWSQDLVGNTGAFVDGRFEWDEGEGVYLVSSDEYGWWVEYAKGLAEVWNKAELLAVNLWLDKKGYSLAGWERYIRDRVTEAMGNTTDMGDEPAAGLAELDVIRAEYGLENRAEHGLDQLDYEIFVEPNPDPGRGGYVWEVVNKIGDIVDSGLEFTEDAAREAAELATKEMRSK